MAARFVFLSVAALICIAGIVQESSGSCLRGSTLVHKLTDCSCEEENDSEPRQEYSVYTGTPSHTCQPHYYAVETPPPKPCQPCQAYGYGVRMTIKKPQRQPCPSHGYHVEEPPPKPVEPCNAYGVFVAAPPPAPKPKCSSHNYMVETVPEIKEKVNAYGIAVAVPKKIQPPVRHFAYNYNVEDPGEVEEKKYAYGIAVQKFPDPEPCVPCIEDDVVPEGDYPEPPPPSVPCTDNYNYDPRHTSINFVHGRPSSCGCGTCSSRMGAAAGGYYYGPSGDHSSECDGCDECSSRYDNGSEDLNAEGAAVQYVGSSNSEYSHRSDGLLYPSGANQPHSTYDSCPYSEAKGVNYDDQGIQYGSYEVQIESPMSVSYSTDPYRQSSLHHLIYYDQKASAPASPSRSGSIEHVANHGDYEHKKNHEEIHTDEHYGEMEGYGHEFAGSHDYGKIDDYIESAGYKKGRKQVQYSKGKYDVAPEPYKGKVIKIESDEVGEEDHGGEIYRVEKMAEKTITRQRKVGNDVYDSRYPNTKTVTVATITNTSGDDDDEPQRKKHMEGEHGKGDEYDDYVAVAESRGSEVRMASGKESSYDPERKETMVKSISKSSSAYGSGEYDYPEHTSPPHTYEGNKKSTQYTGSRESEKPYDKKSYVHEKCPTGEGYSSESNSSSDEEVFCGRPCSEYIHKSGYGQSGYGSSQQNYRERCNAQVYNSYDGKDLNYRTEKLKKVLTGDSEEEEEHPGYPSGNKCSGQADNVEKVVTEKTTSKVHYKNQNDYTGGRYEKKYPDTYKSNGQGTANARSYEKDYETSSKYVDDKYVDPPYVPKRGSSETKYGDDKYNKPDYYPKGGSSEKYVDDKYVDPPYDPKGRSSETKYDDDIYKKPDYYIKGGSSEKYIDDKYVKPIYDPKRGSSETKYDDDIYKKPDYYIKGGSSEKYIDDKYVKPIYDPKRGSSETKYDDDIYKKPDYYIKGGSSEKYVDDKYVKPIYDPKGGSSETKYDDDIYKKPDYYIKGGSSEKYVDDKYVKPIYDRKRGSSETKYDDDIYKKPDYYIKGGSSEKYVDDKYVKPIYDPKRGSSETKYDDDIYKKPDYYIKGGSSEKYGRGEYEDGNEKEIKKEVTVIAKKYSGERKDDYNSSGYESDKYEGDKYSNDNYDKPTPYSKKGSSERYSSDEYNSRDKVRIQKTVTAYKKKSSAESNDGYDSDKYGEDRYGNAKKGSAEKYDTDDSYDEGDENKYKTSAKKTYSSEKTVSYGSNEYGDDKYNKPPHYTKKGSAEKYHSGEYEKGNQKIIEKEYGGDNNDNYDDYKETKYGHQKYETSSRKGSRENYQNGEDYKGSEGNYGDKATTAGKYYSGEEKNEYVKGSYAENNYETTPPYVDKKYGGGDEYQKGITYKERQTKEYASGSGDSSEGSYKTGKGSGKYTSYKPEEKYVEKYGNYKQSKYDKEQYGGKGDRKYGGSDEYGGSEYSEDGSGYKGTKEAGDDSSFSVVMSGGERQKESISYTKKVYDYPPYGDSNDNTYVPDNYRNDDYNAAKSKVVKKGTYKVVGKKYIRQEKYSGALVKSYRNGAQYANEEP